MCECHKESVSSRLLGDEELLWDAEWPKAEVTLFLVSDLELDQRLGLCFWSSTHQEAVLYMGQVVKIKSWTVCGQRKEGNKVGVFQQIESSGEGWRKIQPVFQPIVSTCWNQKAFHALPWPGGRYFAASVTCLKSWGALQSSQGHTGRCGALIKQQVRMLVNNAVSFNIYHSRIWSILSWGYIFPNNWWMINCCCWFVWLLSCLLCLWNLVLNMFLWSHVMKWFFIFCQFCLGH